MSYRNALLNSSARTGSVHQSLSYKIEFKVCELRRKDEYKYVEVRKDDTITTLKDKIACVLNIVGSTSKFFLEVYDTTMKAWKTINDEDSSCTIQNLKIEPGSLFNVKYRSYEIWKNGQLPSTSTENDKRELIFKLCTQPTDEHNFSYLSIPTNSTLRNLRIQAYEYFKKSAGDRPIYRKDDDTWKKFGLELDYRLLRDLGFRTNALIALDYDENNYTSGSPAGLRGLVNLGSTCFMNSVFQCLSNAPEFTEKILALGDDINSPILVGYIQLMKQMWSGKSTDIEPDELVTSIGDCLPTYTTYRQQDAQEFMNHFLHLIHGELSQKETLITELFYGHIRSTVKCLTCQKSEITNESISFLPVPISNYDVRTVLYLKADGEQCLVSIPIDSSVRWIHDLTDNFIKQYDPKLTRHRIEAVQLNDNQVIRSFTDGTYLADIRDNELAFLERPEKRRDETDIWCIFINHSTGQAFRPPTLLIGPSYSCRYVHLSEQIDQLIAHLCSITNAESSYFHAYWRDWDKKEYKLTIGDGVDKDLPYIRHIVIKLDPPLIDAYRKHYNDNYSTSNSGLCRLLDDFFDEAPLDGDYQCLKCSNRTKARQKSDLILPLPRVLIIQLKRFTYNDHSREKIDTLISFPLHGLDLKKYLLEDKSQKSTASPSTTYDLVAVSNHSGSMSFGHYTTYAKNKQDQNWYSFDDRYVRKLYDPSDVVTKNAYILVYIQNNG